MSEGPDRWQQLSAIFERALEHPPGERTAFVEAASAGDPELARELRSLLEADAIAHGPLESLTESLRASSELTGAIRIGPYRLVRELGRGGMGVVYLARRSDGQYSREVALKLAQSPVLDATLRERFFAERDILARLSHPHIAPLFDGGVTEEGHPYFTMEYVDGRPIDVYCDEERLAVPERLRLFLQVCGAVAAAHRSLVVHRDLKPSNVLVNAAGEVKLLDFGIAKLLDPLQPGSETQPAVRLFTRDYASPEQVSGGTVTTASDVYSLGALLYRLLTGTVAHRFAQDTPSHIAKVICDDPPLPPSAAARAEAGRTDRRSRILAGDLDNIVLRALSKDPARRYASVELFAQDLEHYLAGRPVAARADSRAYRAGKFVRRHRLAVTASLVVTAAILSGGVTALVQARRAHAAAERAQRISTLVTDLFRLAEPGQVQGGTITARELLDRGAERIASELAGDPDAQATMYGVVGRLYRNLALNEPAGLAFERALVLRRQASGTESLGYAEALSNMADLLHERSDFAAAEPLHRQALALRRALGAPPRDVAASLEGIGRALSGGGKHRDADAPLREALDLRRRHGGERGTELVETMHELALARLRGGQATAAEPLFREAVELGRRLPAASADLRVNGLVNLGRLRHRFDRQPAQAEALYREALDLARRWYPSEHPDVALCLSELAAVVRDLGRLEEAETLAREALTLWELRYGPQHREVIVAAQRLAGVVVARGRVAEADRLLRQVLATSRTSLGEGHPISLTASGELASFLEGRGAFAEALGLRESALATARRTYGETDVYVARAWAALGQHHAERGDPARAEEELRHALDIRRRLHPAGHWRIAEAEAALGALLVERGQHAEAEALLAAAVAALERDKSAPPQELAQATRRLADARRVMRAALR